MIYWSLILSIADFTMSFAKSDGPAVFSFFI